MLTLRPNCARRVAGGSPSAPSKPARAGLEPRASECCDRDLPPDATDARICSFECTFCAACAEGKLGGVCPNCGGELLPRPRRPAATLAKYPASTQRVNKPDGCNPKSR